MKQNTAVSKLTILCGVILLALSFYQPAHAQGTEITNTFNDIMNRLAFSPGKVIKDADQFPQTQDAWAFSFINDPGRTIVEVPAAKPSAKALAVKQQFLANLAVANISLNPAVVAFLPAGEFLQEKEVAKISVVAGLPRPDVRRIVVVLKREGTTYPYVTEVVLPAGGLKQFESVEVWNDLLPGTGNYSAWVFSLADSRAYLESVRTRLYSGLIEHADDEDGMQLTKFTTQFTGSGWYATMKGRHLGLRTLVMVTYFGLVVPFETNPVMDNNGNSEDSFFLPFSVSQPFSDITLRCDVTIQNLDGLTFESVTRRQFGRLRTRYEPQQ